MQIIPVILAGGSGTRLWPLSRKNYPKQFLKLNSEYSLLQETLLRADKIATKDIQIITSEDYYFLCLDQIDQINVKPTNFILEPYPKSTAPAIAIAALDCLILYGSDCVMVVLSSDNAINQTNKWIEGVNLAATIAQQQNKLITFGIVPSSPNTAYGYIKSSKQITEGAYFIEEFTEKPNLSSAQSFVADGSYYWNSGMFVFKPEDYLKELNKYSPDIYEITKAAYKKGNTDLATQNKNFSRIDKQLFSTCPSNSIDYAVLEKTTEAVVIPLDITWSDLGCWASVYDNNQKDQYNNVSTGNVIAEQTTNCILSSENKLLVTLGVDNQIIISTKDAILVADKKYSQQVKNIVENLRSDNKHHRLVDEHKKVFRPWGYYETLLEYPTFKVKYIMVKPGAKLSLQLHNQRAEHWVVVSGVAEVVNNNQDFLLQTNQSTYIPSNTKHRLSNPSLDQPLIIVEVQSGSYLGEDDIVRFDDIYDRVTV